MDNFTHNWNVYENYNFLKEIYIIIENFPKISIKLLKIYDNDNFWNNLNDILFKRKLRYFLKYFSYISNLNNLM